MQNQSEIDQLLISGAFSDGVKIGNKVLQDFMEGIKSGHIKMPLDQPLNVEIKIHQFSEYEPSMNYKILAKLGSPYVMALGNTGLAVGGGGIFLVSGKSFLKTKNKTARLLYVLSMVCSGTAATTSIIAVYCNKCGLSPTGMLGDGFGGLFLKMGHSINNLGEIVEGKQQSSPLSRFLPKARLRRPVQNPLNSFKGIAFLPNSNCSNLHLKELVSSIPYRKIFIVASTVLVIYGYSKILIRASRSIYRYSIYAYRKKKSTKSTPKLNYSQFVRFTGEYLVQSFSLDRVYKIYYAALQL
jgi:hypothetical protein